MKIDVFFGNPILREIALGYLRAFECLGHNAVGVDPSTFRLPERSPELVLVVWPYAFQVQHFEHYRRAAKVLVVTDDPYEIDHMRVLSRNFDVIVSYEPATLGEYERAIQLPLAFDHITLGALTKGERPNRYDVCFLGGLYTPRRALLESLRGDRLRLLTPLGRSTRMPFEEYYAQAVAAHINLNFHREPAGKDYPHCSNRTCLPATAMNCRYYTLGGLGCFQLLYRNREAHPGVTREQLFSTPQELEERIKFFLDRPAERRKLAEPLQEIILSEHCYTHRAKAILDYVQSAGLKAKDAVDLEATALARSLLEVYWNDFSGWVRALRT
jgi:hypothetical protein